MTAEEESFDFVIVGSGGGGMVAAIAAADAGLKPVLIEKQATLGGSTAMSGGGLWVPNNPLMQADGVADSEKEALDYFEAVVGEPDRGSSLPRRKAFISKSAEMIAFLQRKGVKFLRAEGYSDYYDNRKGGKPRGRTLEGAPWDARQLGAWRDKINPGMARHLGMPVKLNEIRHLPNWLRSGRSFRVTVRIAARTYLMRMRRKDLLTMGMSLSGQLTKVMLDSGIPLWTNTAVQDLVTENGRVVGVKAVRDGNEVTVRAKKGVLISAGGFERNRAMRLEYTEDSKPNDGSLTMANPGNTGEVLASAIALGAKTDYMDEAVWVPSTRPEVAGSTLALARQRPHTIMVNKQGRRFVNESNSNVEVPQAMYANDAVPAWLIFDDEYRRRIPWASGMPKLRTMRSVLPGRMPQQWIANGWVKKAGSIAALAMEIGVDADTLQATVKRFNEHAAEGRDPDFGRGESQYNRVLGDVRHKPNPALGPVATPPFYATEILPGDVGTIGGVVTNENAQVLAENGEPIPGLYATGNLSATVMGKAYPGAGASIAHTTTFGYIAARHAATQTENA
jgi:3-oxosteroid 1-dehydrogenase